MLSNLATKFALVIFVGEGSEFTSPAGKNMFWNGVVETESYSLNRARKIAMRKIASLVMTFVRTRHELQS